ncbi:glycoside hydrolase family 78 protein [Chitinophaga horti]|uniref:alpha-L-rhamnosidase n=1 Tax=Chitinophaga horti TaxID=2920382 RepID=A0ABY6J875_9BACT|nr:glycoside hydrolase family 78 protein [Chitinophaga horti]UYQ95888.1 glycoside hydrolase family 78 protein [Chitinophaga horti]
MKKTCLLLIFTAFTLATSAQLRVQLLRIENLVNPIGLDEQRPAFSWQLVSGKRNTLQTAYEIRTGERIKGVGPVYSTGKVNSGQSVHVRYDGPALEAGKHYYWQVRVWDNNGQASGWSEPAYWQTGLMQPSAWKASWITPGDTETVQRPSPLMRKTFSTNKRVVSATAYITAHGLYEAQINGQRVGDAYFTPGWTTYQKRLQYQAYDVTKLLKQGANAIGVTLGSGWYRGDIGWHTNVYGKDIALLFQLAIQYADGSSESIVSDGSWKSSTGAIRYSELYHGEIIDARLHKKGWDEAGYNDQDWTPVKTVDFSKNQLIATYNEPVKKHETFKPVGVIHTPKGELVLDFGQNLAGWVVIKAKGKRGDSIIVSHAEVLDKAGNFYTENLRAAKAKDIYVLADDQEHIFEPHFTWHGFRYVKLEGYPGSIHPDNFTAVALYSAMPETGSFSSSHKLLNQLQHNIEWGLRGNFLDVPTDCPQRDERLGWTGDAQAFFRTASFLRGVDNFFSKWMKDVAAEQTPEGSVPKVVPNMLGPQQGGSGWSDVATIVPWNMYLAYGDKQILEDQYPSMKKWVDFVTSKSPGHLWKDGHHYGDWLFYSVNDDRDGRSAITDRHLIAQCFYGHSTQLLINAARVLGKNDDVKTYQALLDNIKSAFINEYTTPNGALVSNTQTAYVLALQFDMLPEQQRAQAADRLVANIKQYRNHLTTGFIGTPYLCHVLSRFGHTDMAYTLLLQESYPSWLYPVKMGATTIWERWDGIKPNGTFQEASMNSFNHYAYGAIGDWMYRVMVGLDTEEDGPGYKKITIKPHIGGGLEHASATYQTNYGELAAGWKKSEGQFTLDATIPPNTTATIYLPATPADKVTENGVALSQQSVDGRLIVKVGSGSYKFVVAGGK